MMTINDMREIYCIFQ